MIITFIDGPWHDKDMEISLSSTMVIQAPILTESAFDLKVINEPAPDKIEIFSYNVVHLRTVFGPHAAGNIGVPTYVPQECIKSFIAKIHEEGPQFRNSRFDYSGLSRDAAPIEHPKSTYSEKKDQILDITADLIRTFARR
jgi:hypothetical protein